MENLLKLSTTCCKIGGKQAFCRKNPHKIGAYDKITAVKAVENQVDNVEITES